MLDYAQLLGMNGGNAQAANLMQGVLQPGAGLLGSAGPTPTGQNPMTGGPSRFSMGTAIGMPGQAGTLMGQAQQQVAAAPKIQAPPPMQQAIPAPQQQKHQYPFAPIDGWNPDQFTPASSFFPGVPGTDNLYYAPDGQLYLYDPTQKRLAVWGSQQNNYGVNDGGEGAGGGSE